MKYIYLFINRLTIYVRFYIKIRIKIYASYYWYDYGLEKSNAQQMGESLLY